MSQEGVQEERVSITMLIAAVREGDLAARDRLFELVYADLRCAARNLMLQERRGHTLEPTAVVNEVLAQMVDRKTLGDLENRRYFFGAAIRAMRRLLVDHARARATAKRGGDRDRVGLDAMLDHMESQKIDMIDLDRALGSLADLNSRQADVVMLRFLGGLSMPEVASHLGVSLSTAEADLRVAKAFLRSRLRGYEIDA